MAAQYLEPGTSAPEFTGNDQDGKPVSLADFKGNKLVLFFYPKDNTPGCTKEACNLRDNYAVLQEKGFKILGVSVDDEKSHTKFITKFDLPFPLLADTEKATVEAYGVWTEKNMYGRKYMGTARTTYIIDESGKVEHVIPKVKTGDHAAQILALYN